MLNMTFFVHEERQLHRNSVHEQAECSHTVEVGGGTVAVDIRALTVWPVCPRPGEMGWWCSFLCPSQWWKMIYSWGWICLTTCPCRRCFCAPSGSGVERARTESIGSHSSGSRAQFDTVIHTDDLHACGPTLDGSLVPGATV